MHDWFITYTGKRFYPFNPDPEAIFIEDIAHALSSQCRYAGHTKKFYSVAQHSVLVSRYCDPLVNSFHKETENAVWGLLHDASEAYITDLPRPIKHAPGMEKFRDAEKKIELAIAERFSLPLPIPRCVEIADKRLVLTELRDMHNWDFWAPRVQQIVEEFGQPYPDLKIESWSPEKAEVLFLTRWGGLTKP